MRQRDWIMMFVQRILDADSKPPLTEKGLEKLRDIAMQVIYDDKSRITQRMGRADESLDGAISTLQSNGFVSRV